MKQGVRDAVSRNDDLAYTDVLTGLGNTRRFFGKVERLIADRADDPAPFAVAIIDLDGFKPINDLFGRHAGDEILMQVALRLNASLDEHSTVSRIGPDEFGFLFPLVFSEEILEQRMRMLIEIISAPYDIGERTARLSASAGCALYFFGDETADSLIDKAESALYQAKRSGRGRAFVYTREMEENARWLTRIEQALRRAVASGEIEPHFQPIVDLRTHRTLGFEALARWTDRDLGIISPALFVPIAEERGIIGQMSQLLLRKAALAAASWPDDVFLSFNLSPSQLVDQNTALHVLSILDRTGLDPRRLQIEITETGVMSDPTSAAKIISDFRTVGIKISLDDFGTGQSSLGRLREFRFDKLKVDRSFVSAITEDQPAEYIVRAILAMCEGLKIGVIAEGIETEGQARKLVEIGCSTGQGYLLGMPRDAETTRQVLRAEFRARQGAAAC